jgi:hypothetical protein
MKTLTKKYDCEKVRKSGGYDSGLAAGIVKIIKKGFENELLQPGFWN